MRIPQPEKESSLSKVSATRLARSGLAIPANKQWPAFEGARDRAAYAGRAQWRRSRDPRTRTLLRTFPGVVPHGQPTGQLARDSPVQLPTRWQLSTRHRHSLELHTGPPELPPKNHRRETPIDRILPALRQQSFIRLAVVIAKPVIVRVAIILNPSEGAFDIAPNRLNKCLVGGAAIIGAGQHDEERRSINGTVVSTKRDLAEACHLPVPHFVQDLPRFGILVRIDLGRLRVGEIGQNASRKLRINPKVFKRRDDAVSPKNRAEPWHTGVRIRALMSLSDHHVQIGGRTIEPVVEQLVRGGHRRVVGSERLQFTGGFQCRLFESYRRMLLCPNCSRR